MDKNESVQAFSGMSTTILNLMKFGSRVQKLLGGDQTTSTDRETGRQTDRPTDRNFFPGLIPKAYDFFLHKSESRLKMTSLLLIITYNRWYIKLE